MDLTLTALRMALRNRPVRPGLVHHADRGVHYAAHAYTEALAAQRIQMSMRRRGNPYDNAQAERFIKTLTYEEVYVNDYETLTEARTSIGPFLEDVYHQTRLHSALGDCPPTEGEAALTQSTAP